MLEDHESAVMSIGSAVPAHTKTTPHTRPTTSKNDVSQDCNDSACMDSRNARLHAAKITTTTTIHSRRSGSSLATQSSSRVMSSMSVSSRSLPSSRAAADAKSSSSSESYVARTLRR